MNKAIFYTCYTSNVEKHRFNRLWIKQTWQETHSFFFSYIQYNFFCFKVNSFHLDLAVAMFTLKRYPQTSGIHVIDPNNHNYDRAQAIALQLESMASQVVQEKVALWNGDILCEGSPCIMRRLVTSTWGGSHS